MAHKFQETINNGFSFLNILGNPSKNSKSLDENDDVYVHPMVKRSASALSTKSLEMCTESLGSETGSDVSENDDEFSPRERLKVSQRSKYRKIRRSEFPPPLTSISGTDGTVKVKHHREGGRLVIKAISFSNCGTNFQAERTNGRLKLTLPKDYCESYQIGRVENEEFESKRVEMVELESESERVEMGENESERFELENYKKGGEVELDENNDEVAVAEDDDHDEGGSGGGWRWDSEGNRWRIAGKGELKMTRCNEGGNGNKVFSNWRSSCMAIS